MKYLMVDTPNGLKASEYKSYVENILTQDSGQTDFAGVAAIKLNIVYSNIFYSNTDTSTTLSTPVDDINCLYYIDDKNKITKYTGTISKVQLSQVPVLTAASDNVISNVSDAWKVFDNDLSTSVTIKNSQKIVYNFDSVIKIYRLSIKGTGTFIIEGSSDNINYVTISVLNTAEDITAIENEKMVYIDSPGAFNYYRITASTDGTIQRLKYFLLSGDTIDGKYTKVFYLKPYLFLNSVTPDILDTEFVLRGDEKINGYFRYDDLGINDRILKTKIVFNKNDELIEYRANVYRKAE